MASPDRYTCEEAFRRLDDYVDRELGAEEMQLVKQHLETCVVCASEYEFESSVLDHVRRKVRRVALPPGLLERLTRRLEREGGDPSGS